MSVSIFASEQTTKKHIYNSLFSYWQIYIEISQLPPQATFSFKYSQLADTLHKITYTLACITIYVVPRTQKKNTYNGRGSLGDKFSKY